MISCVIAESLGHIVDHKRALYSYNWVVRRAGVEIEVEVTVAQVRHHTWFLKGYSDKIEQSRNDAQKSCA